MLPDHVLGLQTPSTQGHPFISLSLSRTHGQLIRSPSFIPRSALVISTLIFLPCLISCSGGCNLPRPPVLSSGWNWIIMGQMVLVDLCTGKCWPCVFMYLFIPHTGKCFSTVYRARLQNGRSPSRTATPFLARWLCLCVVMVSMERLHRIKDVQGGGGGGGGSERRYARISQVISNVAAATFFSVSPQTPSRVERQNHFFF